MDSEERRQHLRTTSDEFHEGSMMDEEQGGIHGDYPIHHHRRWQKILLQQCGPMFLFITIGIVIGALFRESPEQNHDFNNDISTGQEIDWAFEGDCDKYLQPNTVQENRVHQKVMCLDHTKFTNFARKVDNQEMAFVVIGDWGRDGFCCQRDVAHEMGRSAILLEADFVLNNGDSFYPDGILGPNVEQVETSWRDVYLTQSGLSNLSWYGILGNHDYYGMPEAELGENKMDPLWMIPDRYYSKVFSKNEGFSVHIVFMDTTPFLADTVYKNTVAVHSFLSTTGRTQESYLEEQINFLRKEFENSTATFRMVVAHHPCYTSSVHHGEDGNLLRDKLAPIFSELKVSHVFNGHDHVLAHHLVNGTNYFISGAGAQVRPLMQVKDTGFQFQYGQQGGYMAVSMNKTMSNIEFLDYQGSLVHEVAILLT